MKTSLSGRNIIVTGASSGIGEHTAKLFAERGANVAIAARIIDKLKQLKTEIAGNGTKIIEIQTDVSKLTDCRNLIKQTADSLGSIDIMVNNAGFTSQGNFEDVDIKDLDQIIEVNFKAPIRLTKLALPYIKKSPQGRIINVASILGIIPLPSEAVYSATKFALRGFSYALAEELENTNVKVCLICPGPVDTPFIMENIEKLNDLVFSPPVSTPEEIAKLIIKSAEDGKIERIKPVHTGILAKIGFLLPPVKKLVLPIMKKQGKERKRKYIEKYYD